MPERTRHALIERAAVARQLASGDPALLGDYARWFLADRLHHTPAGELNRPRPSTISLEEAHAHIRTSVGDFSCAPALELVREASRRGSASKGAWEADAQAMSMAGDSSLGELVYGLVRATQPEVVVETGVATGVTSAYVLAALSDNARGRLHSIDLPPTHMITARLVGVAVPNALRDRWSYHWGSSRRLLPRVLRSVGGAIQIFVHDSDHSYAAMRWELEQAWSAVQPGGWLVADDATLHSAVDDLAKRVGAYPVYVRQFAKPDATALLRKTPRVAV
jgi:predicted O-methyltransferase YrrM